MINTAVEKTEIGLMKNERVVLRKRSIGGFIEWESVVKKDQLSRDLIVVTTESYDLVIVNGVEYEPKKENDHGTK